MGAPLTAIEWWRFPDPWDGLEWTVILTTRRLTPDLAEFPRLWGLTIFGPRVIYIDAGQPLSVLFETAQHELFHVAYGRHAPGRASRGVEERFIARISPKVWAMGGMGIPRVPKGFDRLRRAALRIEREECL